MGYGAVATTRRCEPRGLRLMLEDTARVPDAKGRTGGSSKALACGILRVSATGEVDLLGAEGLVTRAPSVSRCRVTFTLVGRRRSLSASLPHAVRMRAKVSRKREKTGLLARGWQGRAAREADTPDGRASRETLLTREPIGGRLLRSKGGGADVLPRRGRPRGQRLLR